MTLGEFWDVTLGRKMTRRLMRWIVPGIIWNQEIYGSLVQEHMSNRTRWLDLGCGRRLLGNDLEPIEDRLVATAGDVVGCDVDFASVVRHRNIQKLVIASAEALPFRDGSFDLITCNMVVEHLRDPHRSFSEMARVLSSRGRVIIHTPNLANYAIFLNHTLVRLIPRRQVLKLIDFAERRKEQDVFVAFYRANTIGRLSRLMYGLGLREESCRFLAPPTPFFSFFAPLALIQILLSRLTMSRPFRRFSAIMLVVFRREAGRGEQQAKAVA